MSRAQTVAKAPVQARKKPKPKVPPRSASFLSRKKLNVFLCVLLAAATFVLYSPVTGYSFIVLDDNDYVTSNLHIHRGLSWSTIKWAFTSTEAANWHPLTWLSHALDYQLFALNPAGHHLDSVLIHALNAVVLFLLLAWVTKRVGPSLLVAALFALHPLNVESVAWVAERKNVLSTLLFFLAIVAYVWYAHKPDWRRYLLVAALFAAGLMAKPMVITLPFVLLLLDYWPLERTENGSPAPKGVPRVAFWRLLLEKVPLLLLSVASAFITLKAQRSGHAVRSLHQFPFAIRIENAVESYGLYLWKMFWPAQLAPLYPHPAIGLPAWQWIGCALILAGITVLVVTFRSKRYLPVGWFWFLGTLVPVIGLVQVGDAAMADRYAYIPLIGIFVMIVWSLDDWADAKRVRTVWRVIPALCVLSALGFATSRQLSYWQNEYTLWTHALTVTERNPFAHDAVGSALMEPDSAAASSATSNRYGSFDRDRKRKDEARQHFERALELRRQLAQQNPAAYLPDVATTLNNLGNLDRLESRTDDARRHYEEALKDYEQLAQQNAAVYLPYLATTLNNLGNLDLRENRTDDARLYFERAFNLRQQLAAQNQDANPPEMAVILNNLAVSEKDENRFDDARQHYEEALQSYRQLAQQDPAKYLPYVAGTLNNLGSLDKSQNRIEESRAHYQEALSFFRKLAEGDSKYAGAVARVEASLQELDKKVHSQ